MSFKTWSFQSASQTISFRSVKDLQVHSCEYFFPLPQSAQGLQSRFSSCLDNCRAVYQYLMVLSTEMCVFSLFQQGWEKFLLQTTLANLCYEVNHAASYVLHRDGNYPQIGSLVVFYKTFSCVHNLLIMPLEILSLILLSVSKPNFSHDVSPLCPQLLIFISGFYNLEFFYFSSSDFFVYNCCENHASL